MGGWWIEVVIECTHLRAHVENIKITKMLQLFRSIFMSHATLTHTHTHCALFGSLLLLPLHLVSAFLLLSNSA